MGSPHMLMMPDAGEIEDGMTEVSQLAHEVLRSLKQLFVPAEVTKADYGYT